MRGNHRTERSAMGMRVKSSFVLAASAALFISGVAPAPAGVVVDNLSGKLYLIVYADPAAPDAHARALARLEELRAQLRKPAALPPHAHEPSLAAPRSNTGDQAFYGSVAKCKQYIVDEASLESFPASDPPSSIPNPDDDDLLPDSEQRNDTRD